MKKLLFVLISLMICSNLSSKEKPYLSLRILYPYSENVTNEYEDSIVKIYFDISEKALYLKVYNKTNSRMNLEWENFRIDNSAIAFETDRRLKMDEYKADEVIFPDNYSTHNYVIPKKAIGDSFIKEWWSIDKIKKAGEQFTKVIIPIRINDKNIDYVFYIGVACVADGVRTKANIPSEEQINSLCEGMKYEDVISLIGYPIYYTYNEKNFTAHYFNGLSIEFHTALKAHALILAQYSTPSTINIGLLGKKKTKILRIDKSHVHNLSPEQYYRERRN